ncbi:MAG TPA: GFA family protein [Hellea balneolensis]|uniref:GFA family protein n=1 Tax=Hellea balneolensis TaxID=287478 RepID=A0A7C5R7N3_9PROT|nr:GFA family protein [Hellea balneolensis]
MELDGGCYCGKLRYKVKGTPTLKAQCHCRPCQYISGGGPNYFMLVPKDGFAFTKGTPKAFKRRDIPVAVTREFCPDCGTHIITRRPGLAEIVLKIGTLDDPSAYKGPQIAIFTEEEQCFHQTPDGVPKFDKLPPGV